VPKWLTPSVLIAILITVVAVIGVSTFGGYQWGKSSGAKLVRKMLDEGAKVVRERDKNFQKKSGEYQNEILDLRNRTPRRVYLCPDNSLPEAPRESAEANTSGVDRKDEGPILREATDYLIMCKKLIEAL